MDLDWWTQLPALQTPVKEGMLVLTSVGIFAIVWLIYCGVVYAMQKLGASSHKAKNWCKSTATMIFINVGFYMASYWSPGALKLTWTINFFVLSTVVHFFVMENCVYIKNIPSGGTAIAESLSPYNEDKASSWHSKLWCGGAAIFLALSCVVPCNIPLDIGWACQILATLVAFAMNKDLWDDGNWIGSLMPMQHAILHVMCCMSPIANTQLRHDLFKIWRGSTKRSTRDSLCENLEKLLVLVMIVSHACCTEETRYKAVASIFWTLFRGLTISSVPMSLKKIYGDGLKWIIMVVFVCFVFAYKDLQVECGFPDDDNIEINVGTVKVGGDNVHVHLEVTWTAQNWQTPNIDPINIEYFNQWKLNKVAEGILEPQLPWHILYKNNSTHKCELNVPHLGSTLASTAEKTFPLQWILLYSRWSTPLDMVKDWDLSDRGRVKALEAINADLVTENRALTGKNIALTAVNERLAQTSEITRLKNLITDEGFDDLEALILSHNTLKAPEDEESYHEQVGQLKVKITRLQSLISGAGFRDLDSLITSHGNLKEKGDTLEQQNKDLKTDNTKCLGDLNKIDKELDQIQGTSRVRKIQTITTKASTCGDSLADANLKLGVCERTTLIYEQKLNRLKGYTKKSTHEEAVVWAQNAAGRITELQQTLKQYAQQPHNTCGSGTTTSQESEKLYFPGIV